MLAPANLSVLAVLGRPRLILAVQDLKIMTAVSEIGQDALRLPRGYCPNRSCTALRYVRRGRGSRGHSPDHPIRVPDAEWFSCPNPQDGAHIRMSGSTGHHRDLIGWDRQQDMPHQAQGDDARMILEKDGEKPPTK